MINVITDSDYVARTSSVHFSAGETIKFIPFMARNDRTFEFVESLTIRAQLPDNKGSCKTRVNIVDNSKLFIYSVIMSNKARCGVYIHKPLIDDIAF